MPSRSSVRAFDLLPAAVDDVLDLAAFASEYSDAARDALTDGLFDAVERIAAFPHLGRDRDDLAPGLQSFPVNRLRATLFYVATPDDRGAVQIVRVLRQERHVDPDAFA